MQHRVLVFPCGAENALEIYAALRFSLHVELFGASSVDDHGRLVFENYLGNLPKIYEAGFDETFLATLKTHSIEMIFATHDSVAEYLSTRVGDWGIHLINGDPETCRVFRYKRETYTKLASYPWIPYQYLDPADVEIFPVFVKPNAGQGGQFTHRVDSTDQLHYWYSHVPDPLIVEYLPGDEITVDCFTDRHGRLRFIGPRLRVRVRMGVSFRAEPVKPDEEILSIAQAINGEFHLRGPWFFQLKRSADNLWKLLEISARLAGTSGFYRPMGVNLPLLAVFDALGLDVEIHVNSGTWLVDRALRNRFEFKFNWQTVYIDLDDTLTLRGYPNPTVLRFLYSSLNQGKRVVLITRHEDNPIETLKKLRIAPELFDQIIHLQEGQPKSGVIDDSNSIFIDNHFPERMEVFREHGIHVFDVDAIEYLSSE